MSDMTLPNGNSVGFSRCKNLIESLIEYATKLEKNGKTKEAEELVELTLLAPEGTVTTECQFLCDDWLRFGKCKHDGGSYSLYKWIQILRRKMAKIRADAGKDKIKILDN